MGQSIHEWIKQNLWKTTSKRFEGIWSALLDKVFNNGPSNICGRQPLKNIK